MALRMGYLFQRAPWPFSALCDAVFNHTGCLEHALVKNYLKDSEQQMLALRFRKTAAARTPIR